MELGVVGDEDFCLGFRLVGIRHVFEVEEGGDVDAAVERAMSVPDMGILVMPSGLLHAMRPATRADVTASVRPVAIPIGIDEGSDLREKIKQAVGVDLWARDDEGRKGRE
jgi:V/A-type H+-transporting ATPase subunit F